MKHLILFITIFIVVYLFYLLFAIKRKKSLEKWKKGKEMTYLKQVYKLNIEHINIKALANAIGLSNAFIMATVVTAITLFKSFIIQMLVGFLILFPTILVTYHIIGKYFQKQQLRRKK